MAISLVKKRVDGSASDRAKLDVLQTFPKSLANDGILK